MVFYRIKDIYKMDSASFFELAERVGAYKGVIRAKAEAEAYEESERKQSKAKRHGGQEPREVPLNELIGMEGMQGLVEVR